MPGSRYGQITARIQRQRIFHPKLVQANGPRDSTTCGPFLSPVDGNRKILATAMSRCPMSGQSPVEAIQGNDYSPTLIVWATLTLQVRSEVPAVQIDNLSCLKMGRDVGWRQHEPAGVNPTGSRLIRRGRFRISLIYSSTIRVIRI